jgi:hypothetical protein
LTSRSTVSSAPSSSTSAVWLICVVSVIGLQPHTGTDPIGD